MTAEEQQLWEHLASQTLPLDSRPRYLSDIAPDMRQLMGEMAQRREHDEIAFSMPDLPIGYDTSHALSCGAYAGIDRNTADRFRKGELPVDGSIDLHGMTREKAHHTLSGFVRAHYDRGSRFLIIITGKGIKKDAPNVGQGVLREVLPNWLAEPGLRPMVLIFDIAQPKHGGSGAYYLLLRRQRHVHG